MKPEILKKGQKITAKHYAGVTRNAYRGISSDGGYANVDGGATIRSGLKTKVGLFKLKEASSRKTIDGDQEYYCSAKARRLTISVTDQTLVESPDEIEYRIIFPMKGDRRTTRRKKGEVVIGFYSPRLHAYVADHGQGTPDIWLKNTTGSTIPFGFVGIGDPVVTTGFTTASFLSDETFLAVNPPTDSHRMGRFAFIEEDCPNNEAVGGQTTGILSCQVDIRHGSDNFADIDPTNRTRLRSAAWGWAKILWKESGTGVKWCKVELGKPELEFRAKVGTSAIAAGGSGNVTIWLSEATDTGVQEVAHHTWMHGGLAIDPGAQVTCRWSENSREIQIIGAAC